MLARRRSRTTGALRRFLFLTLVLLVLGGALYVFFLTPVFKIKIVRVDGQEWSGGRDFSEGVGQNIFFWQPDIDLGDMPQVATSSLEKKYFSGEVTIRLEPRERYVIWCLEKQGECFWVGDNGVAFSSAPNLKGPLVFHLVRDYSEHRLSLGDRVLGEDQFANLKKAFDLMAELAIPVSEMRIENLNFKEVTAYSAGGPKILFSLLLDPEFGSGVIESLRQSGEWDSLSYVDLRISGRAYYSQ